MTQQTAALPTTRELANKVRTGLGWIDDNTDWLPGGWNLHTAPWANRVNWSTETTHEALLILSALTDRYGAGESREHAGVRWQNWPAEGTRPELTVFLPDTVEVAS